MPYTYLGSATESYYVPRLTIAIYVPSRHSGLPLIRVLQAGHTYHFDFNSFSESTIRDLTSKKFFEVKVPSKGNQGYETLHLDYGFLGDASRAAAEMPILIGKERHTRMLFCNVVAHK